MEIRCVYTEGNQNVIQEAVDRLPASGGPVIVPRGEWKSGAIHLKSNVKLYLEEGCVIHFSSCMEDYLRRYLHAGKAWNVTIIRRLSTRQTVRMLQSAAPVC